MSDVSATTQQCHEGHGLLPACRKTLQAEPSGLEGHTDVSEDWHRHTKVLLCQSGASSQYAPTYYGLTLAPSAQGPRDNAGHDPSGRPRVTALASPSAPGAPRSCGSVPSVYVRTRVSPAMPRRWPVSRRRVRLVFTLWSSLTAVHAPREAQDVDGQRYPVSTPSGRAAPVNATEVGILTVS